MVTEHKKYLMQEHSKSDKQQMRLGTDGKLKPATIQMKTEIIGIDYSQAVMCPFCLHADKLQSFLRSTSKGISHTLATCPECKNGMQMKSLTSEWTPEQYADWVAEYAGSGYWQKCKFATWKERLHQIGWSHRFWTRYKAVRGEDETESYTAYIDRKSQEDQAEYEAQQHEDST